MKRLLALAFLVPSLVSAAVAPASDKALSELLDAAAAGAPVFDGGRSASAVVPVQGGASGSDRTLAPVEEKAKSRPSTDQAPAQRAPVDVQPTQARGVSDGYIGLYKENDFVLGTGRCSACRAPEQGKWYFLDDVIATPKVGPPALVWLGAHELVEGATLSDDGKTVRLKDGTVLPFALLPKIPMNRSYYDASSLAYLQGKTLRLRGEFAEVNGVKTFVARTIWPEDWRIDEAALKTKPVKDAGDIDGLVKSDKGGAKAPFQTELLWKSASAAAFDGKPVMGVMLNGAQGDDDEALAGHFSLFTGRYGPNGSMADWMFDNFYDMNTTSEKGIVAGMVPMDKYMTDLNSGQSWYRPSYLLVMVMKDDRVPQRLQEVFKTRYAQYYAQDFKYDHNHLNCTALITDPVRSEGWSIPKSGGTPKPVARALSLLAGKLSGNKQAAKEIYESMIEEPTRGFPRAAFDATGADALSLAGADGAKDPGRRLSPLEKEIQQDVEALIWVRLPQIPSSRAFGRDPVGGVIDYLTRTKGEIKQTVPTEPRPFPPPH